MSYFILLLGKVRGGKVTTAVSLSIRNLEIMVIMDFQRLDLAGTLERVLFIRSGIGCQKTRCLLFA